jgi:predicted lipid carrier protein YhbT
VSVPYLSQAWLDLQLAVTKDLPERPGATARLQHVVTGTPEGDVRYHQTIVDGRLAEVGLGDHPDAEVTLTQTYADAREVAQGELDASAAFMQGRTKVVGDMGKVMALMPLLQSAQYRDALTELSRQTSY